MTQQMDPNIKIADDIMRDMKGFDEWSFKQKGPKNRKKKK